MIIPVVILFQNFLVLTVLCRLPISEFSGSHCTLSSSYFKVVWFSLYFVVFLYHVFWFSLYFVVFLFHVFWFSLYFVVFLFRVFWFSLYFVVFLFHVFWFSLYFVVFLFHSFLVLTVLCLLPISKFPGSHWNLSSSYFKVFWFSLYCVFFLFHSFMVLSVLSPNIVKQFRHTLCLIN